MASNPPTDEEFLAPDERAPLLATTTPTTTPTRATSNISAHVAQHRIPVHITRRLYVSHFLSTWNSRVFEFGAVLYLAIIYPGTLLPLSLYAFARGLSAIVFAPAVGQYVDAGNRLLVVRVSIVLQRFAVAASCVIFYVLAKGLPFGEAAKMGMLVLLSILACVEKLTSIMNLVSVEKDWVVVMAENDQEALRVLNAQMRRIDLLCKLFGPLFIALIAGVSTEVAIVVNFAMNVASVVVEYFAIVQVYQNVPDLQQPKRRPVAEHPAPPPSPSESSWNHIRAAGAKSASNFRFYLHHRVFLPSFACALLYLTVLSFSGQMVTYLLSTGYNSTQIGIARTLSVLVEVLATWVAPWLMGWIGPVRAGLWMSTWQVAMLVAGVATFLAASVENNPVVAASGLVFGTILSRLGLRGFDMCTQLIVQEEVEAEHRGAFSSVEAAWQNAFELLSYASTMVFSQPGDFKWPVVLSVTAVASASSAYTFFVYLRRGHLLHLGALKTFLGSRGRRRERERALRRITAGNSM
ncbi:Ferroporti-1 [Podospora appendiculata]|uniref:Solute carrier family 40 member n=1 Tax=Podospora appendiculata TaxID=314037 RepID=A0AAE1C7K6_9PEZI|nr:Ferroporti-1 [Podospora appendiculata]